MSITPQDPRERIAAALEKIAELTERATAASEKMVALMEGAAARDVGAVLTREQIVGAEPITREQMDDVHERLNERVGSKPRFKVYRVGDGRDDPPLSYVGMLDAVGAAADEVVTRLREEFGPGVYTLRVRDGQSLPNLRPAEAGRLATAARRRRQPPHGMRLAMEMQMSERISPDGLPLDVTAFAGGAARGPCLQVNIDRDFAQLERHQVEQLAAVLLQWLGDTAADSDAAARERLKRAAFEAMHAAQGGMFSGTPHEIEDRDAFAGAAKDVIISYGWLDEFNRIEP